MATAKTTHATVNAEPTEIVVTAVVARIPLSPDGNRNPIGAAFDAAGEYLAETATADGVAREATFTAWGRTWRAILDASPDLAADWARRNDTRTSWQDAD